MIKRTKFIWFIAWGKHFTSEDRCLRPSTAWSKIQFTFLFFFTMCKQQKLKSGHFTWNRMNILSSGFCDLFGSINKFYLSSKLIRIIFSFISFKIKLKIITFKFLSIESNFEHHFNFLFSLKYFLEIMFKKLLRGIRFRTSKKQIK